MLPHRVLPYALYKVTKSKAMPSCSVPMLEVTSSGAVRFMCSGEAVRRGIQALETVVTSAWGNPRQRDLINSRVSPLSWGFPSIATARTMRGYPLGRQAIANANRDLNPSRLRTQCDGYKRLRQRQNQLFQPLLRLREKIYKFKW